MIKAEQLYEDIVFDNQYFNIDLVVEEYLPDLLKNNSGGLPMYKYLKDYKKEVFERVKDNSLKYTDIDKFLNELSDTAREIIIFRSEGKKKKDILEHLKITDKEYKMADQEIRRKSSSYEMISLNQKRIGMQTTSRQTKASKEENINKVKEYLFSEKNKKLDLCMD